MRLCSSDTTNFRKQWATANLETETDPRTQEVEAGGRDSRLSTASNKIKNKGT